MVGIVQVSRILLWQQSQKNKTLPAAAEEVKETLKEGVEKVEKAVKA